MMAFILRTSVEGVLITAQRRGDKMDKIEEDVISQEEDKAKELLIEFEKTKK